MTYKSLYWTYVLWLFGGFFGLHLIYLGRIRHTIALWISFGGYFGLGLLRDLWCIPDYVADINQDSQYTSKLVKKMKQQPKPSYGIIRHFGTIIVADILGYLVIGAIPHELWSENGTSDNLFSRMVITLLVPIACAVGKY